MSFLNRAISNRSYQQSVVLTVGTVVNSVLGLVFYILVARRLELGDFGYFSFLLAVGMLGADLCDFGMGTSIIKFIKELDFRSVSSVVFIQRLVMAIFLLGLALIAGQFYPADFLISAMVAISLLFLSQFTQSLLAWQAFWQYVAANIFGNLVRLCLLALLWTGPLTAGSAILSFAGANFLAAILAFSFIAVKIRKFPFNFSDLPVVWRKITKFSNWLGLSFGLSAISSRIDIPLIFFLGGPLQAGIYSSASKLVSVFPQVAAAVEGVFAPKYSAKENLAKHQKDYLLFAVVLAVCLLALVPFSEGLVSLVFGSKYLASIGVLQILLVASALFFLAGPFSTAVLYKFGQSRYHLVASTVGLFTSLLFYFLLVPTLGAIGAALVSLISNLSILGSFWLLQEKLEHE